LRAAALCFHGLNASDAVGVVAAVESNREQQSIAGGTIRARSQSPVFSTSAIEALRARQIRLTEDLAQA
jgi:hypothetical protein